MDKNKQTLIEYFKSGEKNDEKIGVEFEHFLINKETLESYSYFEENGQESIANQLVALGWQVDYEEGGHILNASRNGNTLSFEPGGQFEISIKPFKDVMEIKDEYLSVRSEVESLLKPNQALVSVGYHPKTQIESLPLLPKKRYKLMFDYLHTQGSRARNMMKGSASTQVSIDFKDESDFIKKYRVANFLSPFISTLFDGAAVFEGKAYQKKNLRAHIWDYTDPERCKLPKGVFETSFDYGSYAEYILNTKPIFLPSDFGLIETGCQTVNDFSKQRTVDKAQLIHATTMVFPDVRLKQFIEIRMADALPLSLALMLPALIKGLFYHLDNLNKYFHIASKVNDEDMVELNRQIQERDDFEITFGEKIKTFRGFLDQMIEDAAKGLTADEQRILGDGYRWILKHQSYAQYLREFYLDEWHLYREAIIGGRLDV